MASRFQGFPPAALEFLRELERNNTREWFQPRKEFFERTVREPMLELVAALNDKLARFAPEYVTDPKKAVFRIYRDTRFSANKTPYKTHMAASFVRRGLERVGGAGFYVSLNPTQIEIGGGIYHPAPEVLLLIRSHIAGTHNEFRRLLKNSTLRKLLGELQGGELSRMPKGFPADHPVAELLRKKDWIHFVELPPTLVQSHEIATEIGSRFKALAPVLDYLNAPLLSNKPKSDPRSGRS